MLVVNEMCLSASLGAHVSKQSPSRSAASVMCALFACVVTFPYEERVCLREKEKHVQNMIWACPQLIACKNPDRNCSIAASGRGSSSKDASRAHLELNVVHQQAQCNSLTCAASAIRTYSMVVQLSVTCAVISDCSRHHIRSADMFEHKMSINK